MKNKKLIFSFIFGILVLSVFVYAGIYPTLTEEGEMYKISIPAQKGWNLLPSTDSWIEIDEASSDPKTEDNVLFIFQYLPLHKKYIKTHPGTDTNDIKDAALNQDYLKMSADWYYFKEESTIVFEINKKLPDGNIPQNKIKLKQGWNLVSLTPQFGEQEGWGNLKWGNCNIESVYLWVPSIEQWKKWEGAPNKTPAVKILDEIDDLVGMGIAVKSQNDCELGKAEEQTPSIPQLPE